LSISRDTAVTSVIVSSERVSKLESSRRGIDICEKRFLIAKEEETSLYDKYPESRRVFVKHSLLTNVETKNRGLFINFS
jgi:hypothetical protein